MKLDIKSSRKDDLLEDALNDSFFTNLRSKEPEPKKPKKKAIQSTDLGKSMGEFGKDYGLIFANRAYHGENNQTTEICTSTGPNTITTLCSYTNIDAICFDLGHLYYSQRRENHSTIYRYPRTPIKSYEYSLSKIRFASPKIFVQWVSGISDGRKMVVERPNINDACYFNDELYHIEYSNKVAGLFKSPDKLIHRVPNWVEALTVLDKIYFGGYDHWIYSYDGSEVEQVCKCEHALRSLHAVNENDKLIFYQGTDTVDGIIRISPHGLENPKILYLDKVRKAFDIVAVPLKAIHELNSQ
ncbi:hypothetical protein KY330_03455 [Candidatus Woesearchaeota archaeon]|nr:hypothetical protein [Candidatus Woesearchaeota archaeon]